MDINTDILKGLLPTDGWELLLYLVLGVVLPSLVALVTKRLAPGQVKALVLIALAVIGSVLTELAQDGLDKFNWQTTLARAATLFYLAVGAHFGILRNGLTGSNGVLAKLKPDVGLGTNQPAAVVEPVNPAGSTPDISFTTDPGDKNVSPGVEPATEAEADRYRPDEG